MSTTPTSTLSRDELVAANEAAARYFREQLLSEPSAGPRSHLEARGFADLLEDTPWTVGYAPAGWTAMRDHLLKQGHSPEALLGAGLVSTTRRGSSIDRFRDRLTFGIRDQCGDLVGFTARCAPGAGDNVPKYLNTSRTTLYDKGSVLFGLGEQAGRLRDGANLVLVEGPLDALAVDRVNTAAGTRLAPLAACGTAITNRHGEILSSIVNGHVIVAFDRDQAGMKAAEAAYDAVSDSLISLFAARLPNGADPAQVLTSVGPSGLARHLVDLRPLANCIIDSRVEAWPNLRENAEARVACLREVSRVVARMTPSDVTRQAARLSALLDLDHDTVTREIADAVSPSRQGSRSLKGSSARPNAAGRRPTCTSSKRRISRGPPPSPR